MDCVVDAGDLGHPGALADLDPFEAAFGVQFVTQHGLVDDPGGFGFVVQRRRIQRHQGAIGAGLPVGHDDVGVQVRVAAPRGFVLVGDGRQSGQPLQVLCRGRRVVHPRVAGVLVQVVQGGLNGSAVRLGDHFLVEIAGQRPHQRHALGCGERQVKAVHGSCGEGAPPRPVGGDSLVEPGGRHLPVNNATRQGRAGEPGQLADFLRVTGHHPGRYPRVTFGVVLAEPAAGTLTVHRGLFGLGGGLLVIRDAPTR